MNNEDFDKDLIRLYNLEKSFEIKRNKCLKFCDFIIKCKNKLKFWR